MDECAAGNMCQNGECDNTMGSYKCRCEDGYSVKPEDGPGCTDDDECLMGTNLCDPNAECNNTIGGHECKCRDGFTGNGQTCRDINECLTNNGGCDQDAQCINTDGSFKVFNVSRALHCCHSQSLSLMQCVCDPGFSGNGHVCHDIDECSNDPNLCENGQCLNYPGSFRCECEMGFMHPDERNEQSCVGML